VRVGLTLVALLAFLAFGSIEARSQSNASFNGFDLADKSGNISQPGDYRDKYQALGTYTVPDPKGDQTPCANHGGELGPGSESAPEFFCL
jgi:hypothetical protein